jgi:hypothetical protein
VPPLASILTTLCVVFSGAKAYRKSERSSCGGLILWFALAVFTTARCKHNTHLERELPETEVWVCGSCSDCQTISEAKIARVRTNATMETVGCDQNMERGALGRLRIWASMGPAAV